MKNKVSRTNGRMINPKMNTEKKMQSMVVAILIVFCLILSGMIYTSMNRKATTLNAEHTDDSIGKPVVEVLEDHVIESGLEEKEVLAQLEMIEDKAFYVEPIDVDVNQSEDSDELESVIIDVPMPVVPVKPDLAQPENKPETTDVLTNADKQPEYKEEQTTFIPESEPVIVEADVPRGTYLVPDSENPFLQENIPSNGDGGEIKGEDLYQDGVPAGQGDKF